MDSYRVPEPKKYPLAPEGMHNAVAVDVIDEGMKPNLEGKDVPKMRVVWQIDEDDETGKRFQVSKFYTVSVHEKSNLFKDMSKWFGFKHPVPGTEIRFDDLIIGKQCQIQLGHKKSQDGTKTFANVLAVVPLIKGMTGIKAKDYVRYVKKDQGNVAAAAKPKAEYDDDV